MSAPQGSLPRRRFLITSATAAAGLAVPTIVPSSVFGQSAPSRKVQIAQIGCGRIARLMDLPGLLKQDAARVVAVCDVDANRLKAGAEMVAQAYAKAGSNPQGDSPRTVTDYRELLRDPRIDAVAISTPDHWHAEPVLAAAVARKHVYVQKPLSMTLLEGRLISDTLRARKTVFQIGSQQRADAPWPQFRRGCQLVRNGRLGSLNTIKIGLPTDPAGKEEPTMPVPPNLDYDRWLGCTPLAPYTENRVHPQGSFDRPGWLRIESYCLGMITGWGSHHMDVAHWGMGTEYTGPVEIEGRAVFPESGLWNVHGTYHIEAKYANGVTVIVDDKFPNGVRFEGSDGWIFVSRGDSGQKGFDASSPALMTASIDQDPVQLHRSTNHHLDWIMAIQSGQPCATNPEQAHRSTSACILGWIAMKLGRRVRWNPQTEEFLNDSQANEMRARAERLPYGSRAVTF